MKSLKRYRFATDSGSGVIEAYSFGVAKKKLRSMVPRKSLEGGSWGWIEDLDGYRYFVGAFYPQFPDATIKRRGD